MAFWWKVCQGGEGDEVGTHYGSVKVVELQGKVSGATEEDEDSAAVIR